MHSPHQADRRLTHLHQKRRWWAPAHSSTLCRAPNPLRVEACLKPWQFTGTFRHRVGTSQLPKPITVDHGMKFTFKAAGAWAFYRSVALSFVRPNKQTHKGDIESFYRRSRDECFNAHQLLPLDHAKTSIEARRHDYNAHRPLTRRPDAERVAHRSQDQATTAKPDSCFRPVRKRRAVKNA